MSSINTVGNNSSQNDVSSASNSGSAGSQAHDVEQTVQESYIPNILRYLRTGEGPRPVVICCICCISKVLILGLPGHSRLGDADDDAKYEDAYILPCGHVFGNTCFHRWVVEVRQSDIAGDCVRCPVCREPAFANETEANFMLQVNRDQQLEAKYLDWVRGSDASDASEGEGSEEESENESEEEPVSRATLRPAASTWPVLPPGVTGLSDNEEES